MESPTCYESLGPLVEGATKLGVGLTAEQKQQFVTYCRLLQQANASVNLTGIQSAHGIMQVLFLDSLTLRLAFPQKLTDNITHNIPRMVDVGSGAGLPGLPLKIAFPHWSLAMIESTRKKASFLGNVIAGLGLERAEVVADRAESLAVSFPWRDAADICVARAVSPLPSLLELCAPFVKPGGLLLLPKSGDIEAEVRSARTAAFALKLSEGPQVAVPPELELGSGRRIVVYAKQGPTPRGYPRRIGLAQSHPIE